MLPSKQLPWPISWAGVELIANAESCRLQAYLCPRKVWTCGWGETSGVTPTTSWTQAQADARFCESLTVFAGRVRAMCTRAPMPSELAALTSLAYNVGLGAFAKSTVLRLHNAGDRAGAAAAFGMWNKCDGVVLAGLVTRRAAEAALYRGA